MFVLCMRQNLEKGTFVKKRGTKGAKDGWENKEIKENVTEKNRSVKSIKRIKKDGNQKRIKINKEWT